MTTLPPCTDHPAHEHEPRPAVVVQQAAVLGSALGDVARLRLLELLLDGQHCVSELAEESGASLSGVSQRLKLLTAAGLVQRSREGRHVYYTLADGASDLLHQVFQHAAKRE